MRIEAGRGVHGWTVFDVPHCCALKNVVWVDDEAHAYCVHRRDLFVPGMTELPREVREVRRVLILPDHRLVLIDPIDDDEPESVADVIEAARTTPADPVVSAALSLPGAVFALGLRARGFSLN